ncbi:MAG TPA: LysR family transcriptional regulator, partial [Dehalococcoidia bacterium]|nr:LysR family transcriptional regulator [Dehalococcoidia bacterium]
MGYNRIYYINYLILSFRFCAWRFRPGLDIRELTSFYHAARLLSVSRAGTYLGIGQPTVSTHLQRLEEEFNCRL